MHYMNLLINLGFHWSMIKSVTLETIHYSSYIPIIITLMLTGNYLYSLLLINTASFSLKTAAVSVIMIETFSD